MFQLKFQGDLSNLSKKQLEFIQKVIIKDLGFEDCKVVIENLSKNFKADTVFVKKIKIESENAALSMIAKVAPSNEMMRSNRNILLLFNNEYSMYTSVLPKLKELQTQHVPDEEHFRYPKCYGCFTEAPNELVLLEDLDLPNIIFFNEYTYYTETCVRLVLKNIATLHSLSHVLKRKEPDTYENIKRSLRDRWTNGLFKQGYANDFFKEVEKMCIKFFNDENISNFLNNTVSQFETFAAEFHENNYDSEYSVIQHGDIWKDNVLFKVENDVPVEAILIDYQCSKHTNPVFDLLHFIFKCTDHKMRSQFFNEWMDYYHTELDRSLSHFGLKASTIYPRKQLDKDLKCYAKMFFSFCLWNATYLAIMKKENSFLKLNLAMTNDEQYQAVLKSIDVSTYDSEAVTFFKNRVIGLIETLKQFNLV